MRIDVRQIGSDQAGELYIHACPRPGAPVADQADEVFAALAHVLRQRGGRIVEERIFGLAGRMPVISAARARAYGDLDDGVRPTLLAVPAGDRGELAGVFLHAVLGVQPGRVELDGQFCGRVLDLPAGRYVTLSAFSAPQAGDCTAQARAMVEQAEAALKIVGGSFHSVVRTWMWLGDILAWYGPFNKVRNQFFHERGLLDDGSGKVELPASTGIGIGPATGGECCLDLVALVREGEIPELLLAGGDQNPAYDYGSAFSRASRCETPGGNTVFISGTAAIDSSGATEYVDDVPRQVEAAIRHARAVLRDTECSDEDVVNALIYCKTPEVEAHFLERWDDELPWPTIVLVADVCRDDLLFEIELAAAPGAKKV